MVDSRVRMIGFQMGEVMGTEVERDGKGVRELCVPFALCVTQA